MQKRAFPIIIGGCHRSGTTLLRRALNAHSRIHCGPEVKFFRDFFNDYANDRYRNIRFFRTARALLPEDDLLRIAGRAFTEIHRRSAELAGKPRWADKNPENVLHTNHWQAMLGDSWLFVHVVRHPLDTIASMTEAGFPLTLPHSLAGRIDFYRRYTEAGIRFSREFPDRSYRLRYEDLVHDPERTLRCLMTWLGEPFELEQLRLKSDPVAGLGDRKGEDVAYIHQQSVNSWSRVLEEDGARQAWRELAELWQRCNPGVPVEDPECSAPRRKDLRRIWRRMRNR